MCGHVGNLLQLEVCMGFLTGISALHSLRFGSGTQSAVDLLTDTH